MASEKTQELLDSLKGITQKPKKKEPLNVVVSNQYGEDEKGKPVYIDRLYGGIYGTVTLVNKNFTEYKGKINKRSIIIKGTGDNNFRSYAYETKDGRWFDRTGMPIDKPKQKTLVKEEETQTKIEVQKTELTADEKADIEKDFLSRLKWQNLPKYLSQAKIDWSIMQKEWCCQPKIPHLKKFGKKSTFIF